MQWADQCIPLNCSADNYFILYKNAKYWKFQNYIFLIIYLFCIYNSVCIQLEKRTLLKKDPINSTYSQNYKSQHVKFCTRPTTAFNAYMDYCVLESQSSLSTHAGMKWMLPWEIWLWSKKSLQTWCSRAGGRLNSW